MRWLFAAVLLLCGAPLQAQNGPAADQTSVQPCPSDSDLSYVCGLEKPEDVLALPGTKWLIASGFAPGAGLKLVDISERAFTRWFTGAATQIAWDRGSFGSCPGPVDPAAFNARGLSLRALGKGAWRLLVVNHGGRESIEIFDIELDDGRPQLLWRGCLIMPEGQVGNSVASFSDGTILVTVLTRPGTSIADFVEGRRTGAVWQRDPGTQSFHMVPGTDLPGNNGIETDPNNRNFYVVAFGWHAVLVFDRHRNTGPIERIEAPDFMPDNIHWAGTRLLLAGMRLDEPACGGLRRVVNGVADPMLCHRGWIVGEVDLKSHRIATLAYGTPQPGFNGISAATIAGGRLWLGSFQANRLAIVKDWSAQ